MEKIRIQDDLYTYVNQAKLDELVIPDAHVYYRSTRRPSSALR